MTKHLITALLILGISGAMQSCQNSVSAFIQDHQKPIVVYHTKDYKGIYHDLTLLSKDGAVLYIDDTTLILPDTIK